MHGAPPIEAHEQIGRREGIGLSSSDRYEPMSIVPRGVPDARRSNTPRLSASAQCRSSKMITAGPLRDAVEVGLHDARPSRSGAVGHRVETEASSASSNGRPSDPGSAWPASTWSRPAGSDRDQLAQQAGLADTGLADDERDGGLAIGGVPSAR